jgi:hypothetical protein
MGDRLTVQWPSGPSDAPDKQFNWFNVTTWAERDWQTAVRRFESEMYEGRHDPGRIKQAGDYLHHARADYRGRVLSWYFNLCTPMKADECTPNMVATLLAEAWDLNEWRWWTSPPSPKS